jgi:DNA-binding transcriptional LysR family regulator
MEEVLESLKGLSRGRLHIAVASTVSYFAPRLLGAFQKLYPGIHLKLDGNNWCACSRPTAWIWCSWADPPKAWT